MRQLLADKAIGNLAGIWLLVAEHLRLGTWDLLCGWTGKPPECVQPRLAMQLAHEAAVGRRGIRAERTLHKRAGFELANGLPFVATDPAIHHLLRELTVAQAIQLQVALGKIRLSFGDFQGKLLAIDPHRRISHSKRQMRERVEKRNSRPFKMAQTFWILDADTFQPVCFTTGTASRSAVDATRGTDGSSANHPPAAARANPSGCGQRTFFGRIDQRYPSAYRPGTAGPLAESKDV